MSDINLTKADAPAKPPTQIAGVVGIDAHGGMGEAPIEPANNIDWNKLKDLPPFEMFVHEQSGFTDKGAQAEWVKNRFDALGGDALYKLYADWHEAKGCWVNETPMGELKQHG